MRCLLSVALLVSAALPARAADEAKPNTLTPKEVADGWLLLFDGETTFGWDVRGPARAEGGALVLGGGQAATVTLPLGYFELSWEHRTEGPAASRVCTATRAGKTIGTSKGEFSEASVRGKGVWGPQRWKIVADPKVVVGTEGKFEGSQDKPLVQETTTRFSPGCHVVVRLEVPAGSKLFLRNVKLRPTGLKPIFNGKDLTGW